MEVILKLLDFCPQIYYNKNYDNNLDNFEAIASSVLIKIQNDFFLITAAHVLENYDHKKLCLRISKEFKYLIGDIIFTNISENDISNRLDVAICRLNDRFVNEIKRCYNFYNFQEIDFEHNPKEIQNNYLILGYPWKKTKLDTHQRKLKIKPFILYTRNVFDKVYQELKILKTTNFILEYRQRRLIKLKTGYFAKGINPHGISGCGVWIIKENYDKKNLSIPSLFSIIIEQDKNKRYLISTRFSIIYEIIRRGFKLDSPILNIKEI
ncbi:MAG: hypothetical protein GY834_12140 [Bacteroidetes bacterium]|nr:hypothetical protein [Bacteroidota bacterium]